MRIFTIQYAVNNALAGVYDSLDSLERDWPSAIHHPENYIVLESVVNMGILKQWQVEYIDGKVYWEVINDDYYTN
jgi:hypothetical protein